MVHHGHQLSTVGDDDDCAPGFHLVPLLRLHRLERLVILSPDHAATTVERQHSVDRWALLAAMLGKSQHCS
jgi:hypothetical protein